MFPGDLCKKCQHPRAAHQYALGHPTKCGGGACTCDGFED
jgi:hypothetical protein